jgi:hypothetical protein
MANNHTANTANPMEYMKPGLGHTPSYQVSGQPWVSGSVVNGEWALSFPSVTRFVTVSNGNTTGNLKVAFSSNGLAGTNYMIVPAGESVTLEVKVTEIYLDGSSVTASVAAGLTGIPAGSLQNNWSGSAGVG